MCRCIIRSYYVGTHRTSCANADFCLSDGKTNQINSFRINYGQLTRLSRVSAHLSRSTAESVHGLSSASMRKISAGCSAMSYASLLIYVFPLTRVFSTECVFTSLMQSGSSECVVTAQTPFLADTHTTGSPPVDEWVWITFFPRYCFVENFFISYIMAQPSQLMDIQCTR